MTSSKCYGPRGAKGLLRLTRPSLSMKGDLSLHAHART